MSIVDDNYHIAKGLAHGKVDKNKMKDADEDATGYTDVKNFYDTARDIL